MASSSKNKSCSNLWYHHICHLLAGTATSWDDGVIKSILTSATRHWSEWSDGRSGSLSCCWSSWFFWRIISWDVVLGAWKLFSHQTSRTLATWSAIGGCSMDQLKENPGRKIQTGVWINPNRAQAGDRDQGLHFEALVGSSLLKLHLIL